MSATEESVKPKAISGLNAPVFERVLNFFSSVRVGVITLCILVALSMVGMLIVQQNVDGFDSYYASLTPAERSVYAGLGLFDIYHSWYFNLLLLFLSLNIVLASIERFPSAWAYIKRPKNFGTRDWLLDQKPSVLIHPSRQDADEAVEAVKQAFLAAGYKPQVSQRDEVNYAIDADGKKNFSERITTPTINVFAEKGRWNRLGAYIVHVALLTLFLGHFVALQTGFDADVRLVPGEATNKIQRLQFDLDKREKFDVEIPFTLTCTDIQQKLRDPNGPIDVTNTLDWRTQLRIDDPEYGAQTVDISLNQPLSYRGYRFFQAQTIPIGNARSITVEMLPQDGGESKRIKIARMGTTTLDDGTVVEYDQFQPDFSFNPQGQPDTRSGDYNNPVAVLNVTPPGGQRTRVFAFGSSIAENIPVGAPKFGYKWRLIEFERSPLAHVLSIKYDPYNGAFIAWYFGGFGLIAALIFVFFLSHRRVWANVAKDRSGRLEVVMGANANRNQAGFEEKFEKLSDDLRRRLSPDAI